MAKKIYKKMIYTEIRIAHKTEEDKKEFDKKFAENLKKNGYSNRVEYFKECIRNLNK